MEAQLWNPATGTYLIPPGEDDTIQKHEQWLLLNLIHAHTHAIGLPYSWYRLAEAYEGRSS